MNPKYLRLLFLFLSLVSGVWVLVYYWSNSGLDALKYVRFDVMIAAFAYTMVQIIKRNLLKDQQWWNWLYYPGLLSILLPISFVTESNLATFEYLPKFGVLFLILPIILDVRHYFIKSSEQ